MKKRQAKQAANKQWLVEVSAIPMPSRLETDVEYLNDAAILFSWDESLLGLPNDYQIVKSSKLAIESLSDFVGDPLSQSLHVDALTAYNSANTSYINTPSKLGLTFP